MPANDPAAKSAVETRQLDESHAGKRLDVVLAELFPAYSRSRLKQWILEGRVWLDDRACKPKDRVVGLEQLRFAPGEWRDEGRCEPEAMALDIVHEDDAVLVLNKPAGRVVHPAAGHHHGTLQNGLLHYLPALRGVPRAGIVHRLDKDTSGLMVVAKTLSAHQYLADRIQRHEVEREYQAVVQGVLTGGGRVDAPIGRHPRDRIRMAVRDNGREAVTHYRLIRRFRAHSHIRVMLETGRTHQIRVHMSHLRHPLVGDPVYGGRSRIPAGASEATRQALQTFGRQALHASRLHFIHPQSGQACEFHAPLPDDFQRLLGVLEEDLQTTLAGDAP